MIYRPTKDKILVKPIKGEENTSSGIIIPDIAQEKPTRGTIVSIGTSIQGLSVGNIVMYNKFGGVEIKLDNEPYLILREEDILLIEG